MKLAVLRPGKLKTQEMEIMRKNSGFTITELMVTIAVIAILASLAIPNFIAWLPNYRLRSGAEEIQSTLQFARLTAIKRNATATVTFDIANETYRASSWEDKLFAEVGCRRESILIPLHLAGHLFSSTAGELRMPPAPL